MTGTASKPVMFDYNNDGLADMFVGGLGYYDRGTNTYIPAIAQYENIGTPGNPAFELVTEDYEGLSGIGLPTGIVPTFGDLDGDGDSDMLIGDSDGNIHYFQNIAPLGQDADELPALAGRREALDGCPANAGVLVREAARDLREGGGPSGPGGTAA